MTQIVCPVEPYQMDKDMRRGMEDMLSRVVRVEAERGIGHDLMLRVFLAGIHIGHAVTQRRGSPSADGKVSE